jgi:hypothetical protein
MAVGAPSVNTVTSTGAPEVDPAAATAALQAADDPAPQGMAADPVEPTKEGGGSEPAVRDRSGATTRTETLKLALRPSARADVAKHPTISAQVSRRAAMPPP